VSRAPIQGGIRHGFTGAMYASAGENRVRVVMPNGTEGIFDGIGRWVEGDLYDVDPEMCVWVSAERIKASHRLSTQDNGVGDDATE
jgi:hypothetical protein